jgi:TonB family protein
MLFALMVASTQAAAQDAAPAANPAAAGPSFSSSDHIPSSAGYGDAYSLDEIKLGGAALTEDQQVERWRAELAAGRARAGAMLGAYLSYRALTQADCAAARDVLNKADELGSDQAPWLLAQLTHNDTCEAAERTDRERWLIKAASLDNPLAALELMRLYGDSNTPEDHVQRYVWARVAAGYWESTKATQPRVGFDATTLQAMEAALSAADRSRAEAEAAKILQTMLKRHERFSEAKPVEFGRGGAGARAEWVGWQADYRHECQWNLKNNCRGTQRLTYVDLTNKNAEFLSCKIEMRARDFVTGALVAEPLSRRVLIGPQATRSLLLGDVNGEPDKKGLVAACTPVPKLATNAAAGKCRARLQGSVDVQRYYPESARQRGIEGNTVVRYWVPPGSDELTDAEIATSSGNADLDLASIATLRSAKFTRECDYGLSSTRIAFKLTAE